MPLVVAAPRSVEMTCECGKVETQFVRTSPEGSDEPTVGISNLADTTNQNPEGRQQGGLVGAAIVAVTWVCLC